MLDYPRRSGADTVTHAAHRPQRFAGRRDV